MSQFISLDDAQTHLSELVGRAAAGEEIIIARNGVPLARLIPIVARRAPANAMGVAWIAPDFDAADQQVEGMFGGGATLDGVSHPDRPGTTTEVHPTKDIPPGTLRSIVRQSGIALRKD